MSSVGFIAQECILAAESAGINNALSYPMARAHCLGLAYGAAFRVAELAYDLGQEHAVQQRQRLLSRIDAAISERLSRTEYYEFAYEQCLEIVRAER